MQNWRQRLRHHASVCWACGLLIGCMTAGFALGLATPWWGRVLGFLVPLSLAVLTWRLGSLAWTAQVGPLREFWLALVGDLVSFWLFQNLPTWTTGTLAILWWICNWLSMLAVFTGLYTLAAWRQHSRT